MTGTALSGKKYKAYPEYKDSGVNWLKEVPSSWFISDLRRGIDFLTDFEANGSFSDVKKNVDLDAEGKYAWYLRATDLQSGRLGFTLGNRTIDENAYRFLKKTTLYGGELLVAKRGEIGKVYLVPKLNCKATLAPNLYLIRLNERLNPKFSLYWFMSSLGKPQLELANKSTTIGALYKDDVRACQILYPTLEEQQKIASFLDHETTKIDTLIAKQEKLIDLLKEKRQAVISHAVTKGLNPDAPTRDSGVEWLGEVPEHWSILKFGITNKSAELGGNYNAGEGEEGLPVMKMGNLGRGNISLNKIEFLPLEDEFDKNHLLKSGDFLFNTRNSLALVGKVSIWRDELPMALYNSNILRISFEPTLVSSSEYMSYLFNSDLGLSQLRLIAKGTTSVAAVYYKELKSINFPLPTLKEQVEIVGYIQKNTEKLDELINHSQKAIQYIKERKTALISAAVTGKIDVRDWESQGI